MQLKKIIQIKNLNFSYGDTKVLENINLEVEKQDFPWISRS
jgi:ABC-type sugar transport system ATPase subunit